MHEPLWDHHTVTPGFWVQANSGLSFLHRDRLLPQWVPLLAECPAVTRMYEDSALLRDHMAINSLIRILQSVQDFPIVLEGSLTKGVDVGPGR